MPWRQQTPFIGRAEEIEAATAQFGLLEAGSGGSVLVLGEAGVGKSRLLAEIGAQGERKDWATSTTVCLQLSTPMPLHPIIGLLRRLDGGDLDASLHHHAQHEMFGYLETSLEKMAARSPLLLGVDDLQWADQATIDFLLHAVGRLEHLPLLWLLGSRDTADGEDLARRLVHAGVDQVIRLSGLSSAETADMGNKVTGGNVDNELIEEVFRRAGGNPLLSEQLFRDLADNPELSTKPQVPGSVHQVVDGRRRDLDSAADELLKWCAVAPEPVDADWLVALGGPEALRGLGVLLDHGLVESLDGNQVRFVHSLIRDAVYQSMLQPERRHRHSQIADVIPETAPELRAPQLASAERWEEAAPLYLGLAERALLEGGSDDADYLYRQAADHAERSHLPQVERLAQMGSVLAQIRRGDLEHAVTAASDIERTLTAENDTASLLVFLAKYAMALWDDAADLKRAQAVIERLTPLLDQTESGSAHGYLAKAHILNRGGRTTEALPLAEEAERLALLEGDEILHTKSLVHLGLIRGQTVDAATGIDTLLQAQTKARKLGLPAEEGFAFLAMSFLAQHAGDQDRYEEYARTGLALRFLPAGLRALLMGNAAQGLVRRGHLDNAIAELEEAVELASRAGSHVANRVKVTLVHAYLAKGLIDPARSLLESIDVPEGSWELRRVEYATALLREEEEDWEQARALFESGATDRDNPSALWSLYGVVRTSSRLADSATAGAALAEMEELQNRWPVSGWMLKAARGYLMATSGSPAEASTMLDLAADERDEAMSTAQLRFDAAVLRRDRDGIIAAIDSFEQFGAGVTADRCRAIARGLGMRPGRRRASGQLLSEREWQVARLVAAGKTNAEIGSELYLSPRTAERHVSNLLTRLGYRSRTELAAAVASGQVSTSWDSPPVAKGEC